MGSSKLARWFVLENPEMDGGTPVLGNYQMDPTGYVQPWI